MASNDWIKCVVLEFFIHAAIVTLKSVQVVVVARLTLANTIDSGIFGSSYSDNIIRIFLFNTAFSMKTRF